MREPDKPPASNKSLNRASGFVKRVLSRDVDAATRELMETLKQVPLFRNLPRKSLIRLAELVHRRDYKRDEYLYYEGDPGLGMYVVQSGRVRLLIEDESGAVHELRQLGANEIFGRLSLLGDFRRTETVQAITDTRVLGFFRPDLKSIIKRHPASGAAVLEALARSLAAHEAELIRVLVERDGKVEAKQLVDRATDRIDHSLSDAPILP